MKINKTYKKIFSIELYEDMLAAVLRFLIVKPYFALKNHKRLRYLTSAGLIFAIAGGYFLLRNPDSAAAGWWNDNGPIASN